MALTFVALVMIPVNFNYWVFAVLVFLNGLGGGIFTAPNTAAIMSSVPAAQRVPPPVCGPPSSTPARRCRSASSSR